MDFPFAQLVQIRYFQAGGYWNKTNYSNDNLHGYYWFTKQAVDTSASGYILINSTYSYLNYDHKYWGLSIKSIRPLTW